MAHDFDIEPLDASFGAIVTGLSLAALDDDVWAALHAAWLNYALLIFPSQHLTREQQIAFARRFGPLEFDLAPISNVRSDGSLRNEADNDDVIKVLKGNMGWHADFDLHAGPGQGRGLLGPGDAGRGRPDRLGRHARRL